jgi:alginate O-acetyltransferase complex protein AlgI
MTLTDWFRTYVYIPLGGNRRGTARTYRNLLIVWLLTGLWHGASWNFILWGLFFFVILALERAVLGRVLQRIPAVFGHIWTLIVAVFSFYLFVFDGSAPTLAPACATAYLGAMLGTSGAGFADGGIVYELCRNLPLIVALCLGATPLPKRLMDRLIARAPAAAEGLRIVLCLAGLVVCTAYLVDQSFNPFLYFRF